jgi:hypothetical protein
MQRQRMSTTGRREPRRRRRRPPSDHASCVLTGAVQFVDGGARWVTIGVRDASSVGRRLIGSTVTLDLDGARLTVADRNGDGLLSARDLLPGDAIRVSVRLPRAAAHAPGMLRARRVAVDGPLVPA